MNNNEKHNSTASTSLSGYQRGNNKGASQSNMAGVPALNIWFGEPILNLPMYGIKNNSQRPLGMVIKNAFLHMGMIVWYW